MEPNVQYFFEMQATNVEIDLLSVGTQQENVSDTFLTNQAFFQGCLLISEAD